MGGAQTAFVCAAAAQMRPCAPPQGKAFRSKKCLEWRAVTGVDKKSAFFIYERRDYVQIVGQIVEHNTFGQGKVTNYAEDMITVSFAQGDKKFVYPGAFAGFLEFSSKVAQDKVDALYSKQQKEEALQKQEKQKEQERRQELLTLKITPNSQAAFHIDGRDLDEIFASGTVSTGCYLSGYSKGEPRVPNKLKPNSACLLTARPADAPEGERRIVGVSMVKDSFWGDTCTNGLVDLHEQHRLRLKPNRSLRYWDYVDGANPPARWGNMAFKYISNKAVQEILFDLMNALRDTEDGARAQEFYAYFCEINRLSALEEAPDAPPAQV